MRVFCALILVTTHALAQTVEGRVIDSVTGKGIATAQVQIRTASGESAYSTSTDAQGRFVVEGVKPGNYRISYLSPDYWPTDLGVPRVFQVSGAGNTVKLEDRLMRMAKISGRVVDGRGDGVANARLEVMEPGMPYSRTDAKGRFELRLRPGSYVLSVVPPNGFKLPNREPESDRVLVWTRTYYPGVALREAASQIVAWPGGEVSDIQMKLLAVPAHAIRGVLLKPDGEPAPKMAITLGQDAQDQLAHRVESNSDGAFETPSVADGEWRISAEVESDGVKLRATQWVEMAGRELEGVKLRLSRPFTVRGQVVIETPKGTPVPNLPSVALVPHAGRIRRETGMLNWRLRPEVQFEPPMSASITNAATNARHAAALAAFDSEGAIGVRARPDAGGDFTVLSVYPGRYRIVPMPPPPPPYYLAAVRVGEADLTAAEVELSSGDVPITVTYRTDGGAVRGRAEMCAYGPVLLVPQDKAIQSLGFLRSVLCDSQGRYEITAVRPGDYYALAFAGNGPLPQLDDALFNQAVKVSVRVLCRHPRDSAAGVLSSSRLGNQKPPKSRRPVPYGRSEIEVDSIEPIGLPDITPQ